MVWFIKVMAVNRPFKVYGWKMGKLAVVSACKLLSSVYIVRIKVLFGKHQGLPTGNVGKCQNIRSPEFSFILCLFIFKIKPKTKQQQQQRDCQVSKGLLIKKEFRKALWGQDYSESKYSKHQNTLCQGFSWNTKSCTDLSLWFGTHANCSS